MLRGPPRGAAVRAACSALGDRRLTADRAGNAPRPLPDGRRRNPALGARDDRGAPGTPHSRAAAVMGVDDVEALRRFYGLVEASLDEINADPSARDDIGGALERGDLPRTAAMIEACDPAMEWVPLEAEGKIFHGHRGIVRILQEWYQAMVDWSVEPEEILDGGGSLLMIA